MALLVEELYLKVLLQDISLCTMLSASNLSKTMQKLDWFLTKTYHSNFCTSMVLWLYVLSYWYQFQRLFRSHEKYVHPGLFKGEL